MSLVVKKKNEKTSSIIVKDSLKNNKQTIPHLIVPIINNVVKLFFIKRYNENYFYSSLKNNNKESRHTIRARVYFLICCT